MSADLERALGAPITSVTVAWSAFEPIERFRTTAEAVAFARSACGPFVPQVAVSAWTKHGYSTFAGCLVIWNSSSAEADTSVWSVFVDGQAAGAVEQAVPLIGERVAS